MSSIAIIPARSGSKGLPNKNIKLLNGKPLIAYSIIAAIDSGVFDVVHVSTDSEEYAQIARDYGADVPFLRSNETSSDNASSWDVVKEVLDKYAARGKTFDTFMLLQPTSPLRTSDDILKSFEVLKEKKGNAVVSVCEMEHNPLQSVLLNDQFGFKGFLSPEDSEKRRQDMEQYYRINGSIYLTYIDSFMVDTNIYQNNCYAYIMDNKHSIDIDTGEDFLLAEWYLSMMS